MRLVARPLLVYCVPIIGASIGFYLPLSVVPLFAQQSGSTFFAGLGTVALLLATVVAELFTPRLILRFGYRWGMAVGLVLLGVPTLVLTIGDHPWLIVAVCVVRGAGFGTCVVAGVAVTAILIPAERRGEGLALVGIASGVSGMLALPGGVWSAHQWGYEPVFVATAVVTLLALVSVPCLPRRPATADPGAQHGVRNGLRNPALMRPASIFAAAAGAAGVIVTFLPLATYDQPIWVAAAALLTHRAAATVARWVAGRLGDRSGQERLLTPGLLLAAAGMAALAATGTPSMVIGGALVFGFGFGVLQNATLALMYARAPGGAESSVSAIWNAAYDLGMAAGALGAGLAITSVGYPTTFLLTAAVILAALALARRAAAPGPEEHEAPARARWRGDAFLRYERPDDGGVDATREAE